MTREDYLNKIKGLPREKQMGVLINYFNKYREKDLCQAIIVCELLANEFEYYGYKIELPRLYYENGEYQKTIDYVRKWRSEIKEQIELLTVMPQVMLWETLSLKKLGNYDEAITVADEVCTLSKEVVLRFKSSMGESANTQAQETVWALSLSEIGEIYFEQKKYNEAGEYFADSWNMHPTYKVGYYLGYLWLNGLGGVEKDVQRAEQYFYNITRSDGSNATKDEKEILGKACFLLGDVYCNENGYKNAAKARECFKKAQELGYLIEDEEIEQKTANIQNSAQNGNGTKKSGGCYVATCVYGSYNCPEVWTLRRFRDEILSKKICGKVFIKLYYALSPTTVRIFGKYRWFHKLFRKPLDRLINKLLTMGVENTPYND